MKLEQATVVIGRAVAGSRGAAGADLALAGLNAGAAELGCALCREERGVNKAR